MNVDEIIAGLLAEHADALAGMTAEQKAEYLNTTTVQRVKKQETLIRFRTLDSAIPDLSDGIIEKLESKCASIPKCARVCRWMNETNQESGIDIANSGVRDQIVTLAGAIGLTEIELRSLLSLGEDTISLAEAAGFLPGQLADHDITRVETNANQ